MIATDRVGGLPPSLVALAVSAADGRIPAEEIVAHAQDLRLCGYTSLALLRLIDSVENEYGVLIDMEDDDLDFWDLRLLVRIIAT